MLHMVAATSCGDEHGNSCGYAHANAGGAVAHGNSCAEAHAHCGYLQAKPLKKCSLVRVGCPNVDTVQGERPLHIVDGGRQKECKRRGRVAFYP